jgi:flavin reductase (DIM6/NTAB) family NADH-FMN oxidoreductase RutF
MDLGMQSTPALAPVTAARLRQSMRRVPTSVAVVAALIEGEPVGMLIGSFTSMSLDPPLVGFFADRSSGTVPHLLRSASLAFSVLPQEARVVCDAFRLPRHERFAGIAWRLTERGNPVIDRAAMTVEGPIDSTVPVGDHDLVVVRVESIGHEDRRPLIFHDRRLGRLDPAHAGATHLTDLDWSM